MAFIDLRKNIEAGETYKIDLCDGYTSYFAIYRYNGEIWERILYHKNCSYCNLTSTLTTKELIEIITPFKKEEYEYLGILEAMR